MANANAASRLYVCPVPQNVDLTLGEYELLDWTEVKAIGNHGETGNNTNILTYDTWDTTVIQKAKGMTNAGDPEIEVARIEDDAGQEIMRVGGAVGNNNNYAFRMVRSDAADGGEPSVFYNRGIITGPRRPNGRNEDFDLELYTLGLNQQEVRKPRSSGGGAAPLNTVAPGFTGFSNPPEVGEEGTLGNGTFTGDAPITYTYQWYRNGVAISGATESTYTPVAADVGKLLSGRVRATNAFGSAIGFTALSAAVVTP